MAGDFLELESQCGLGLLSEGRGQRVGTYWVCLFFWKNPRPFVFPIYLFSNRVSKDDSGDIPF